MNDDKKIEIFKTYSIPKAFLALVIPTIISQIIVIIYNYADTWFLGKTNNSAAVAALAVCMPLFIILNAIANLFGIGGSSLIARFLGGNKKEKACSVFAFSLYGSITVAIIYALIIFIFNKKIIYFAGGDEQTFNYCKDYIITTVVIGGIPTILNNVLGHLVRSVGASKESSFGMGIGGILNIILDPLFMFVILPKGNEVIGAAIATALSNFIATLYFIIYISKNKNNGIFTLNIKNVSFDKEIVSNVLLIGFPAAIGTTLAMVSNIFVNKLLNEYGTNVIAGMGVAKKTNTLAFNICMGITQGMLPFIAFNYAAKEYKRMKKGFFFMLATSISFALIIMMLFKIFTSSFITFFIKDEEVVKHGVSFLNIIAYAVPLCALSFSINTFFQALGKKVCSFILSILRKGLFDIPLMFILKKNIGIYGVSIATPVAEIMAALIAIILFLIIYKKTIKTE